MTVIRCDGCPEVTLNVVAACASVGIEHGRTTGEELALWMRAAHERHLRAAAEAAASLAVLL